MLSAKKIGLATSIAVVMLGASACSPYQGDLGNKNIRSNQVKPNTADNLLNGRSTYNGVNRFTHTARPDGNVNPYAANPSANPNRETKMELSDKIADQITAMKEVQSSYVMLTNNNAYVAVVLHRTTPSASPKSVNGRTKSAPGMMSADVSNAIKSRIAQKVQSIDPRIQNIYVSANPDFVGRMTNYATEVNQGRPLAGFAQEFNAIVQRLFPTNAAPRTNQPGATGNMNRMNR